MDIIAEERIEVLHPDGDSRDVQLRIGRPRLSARSGDEWVCEVQANGLRIFEDPTELFGVGSLHTLMIGVEFLRRILAIEVERGAILRWHGEADPIHLDELFARTS